MKSPKTKRFKSPTSHSKPMERDGEERTKPSPGGWRSWSTRCTKGGGRRRGNPVMMRRKEESSGPVISFEEKKELVVFIKFAKEAANIVAKKSDALDQISKGKLTK